jgi:hypothetical protein
MENLSPHLSFLPENVIPSANRFQAGYFPDADKATVLLPESFRGGCSFGVSGEADLSRLNPVYLFKDNACVAAIHFSERFD